MRRPSPLIALLVLQSVTGCLTGPLMSQLPVYVDIHGFPPLFTASLQTAQMLLGAVASILGGLLADALGSRRALVIGITGGLLAALIFVTGSPVLMLLLAVGGGAALGIQNVAGQGYLLEATRRHRIGLAAAVFFLGNTLGSAAANLVAGPAIQRWGFSIVMGVIAAALVVVIAGAALLLPETAHEITRRRPVEVLRGYATLLSHRRVALLCAVRYLTTCYWGAATLLLPLLIHRVSGSVAVTGVYAAVSLTVAAPCSLLCGRLWDRFHTGWMVPGLIAGVALDSLALSLFAGNLIGLFVAGTAGAALAWSLSALMPGLVGSVTGAATQGRAVGLLQSAWSLAMLSGALVGGGLVTIAAPLPFLAVTVPILAALLCMLVLQRTARLEDAIA